MIVCSCNAITESDIEQALIEILNRPDAPIPTPGIVYRHLKTRMHCCGCAPLAVDTIYRKVEVLERKGAISPYACARVRLRFSVLFELRALAKRTSVRPRTWPDQSEVSEVEFA